VVRAIERGACYWANLEPTVGHEQAGMRPVLVLSGSRFNVRTHMVIAVPLTTRNKLQPPFAIDMGLVGSKQGYALPAQVRCLSVERLTGLIASGRELAVEACLDALLQVCGRGPRSVRKANDDG